MTDLSTIADIMALRRVPHNPFDDGAAGAPSTEAIERMLSAPRPQHPGAELFARLAGQARRLERRPVDRGIDPLAARQSFAEYVAGYTGHRLAFVQRGLALGYGRAVGWLCDDEEWIRTRDLVARRYAALREARGS